MGGGARRDPVLQRERRPPDPGDPRLDRQLVAEVGLRAEGDPDLGQDHRLLLAVGRERERLARDRLPVRDPGGLAVRQEARVVGVAHGVGVAEPHVDAEPVRERARQVARVRRDLDPGRAGRLLGHPASVGGAEVRGRTSTRRSRSELVTTLTDDSAIAPAANAGLIVIPKVGYRTPIATGISTTL